MGKFVPCEETNAQTSGVSSKLVFSSSIKKLTCLKDRFRHLSWLGSYDVLANYVAFFWYRSQLWISHLTKMRKKTRCIIQLSSSLAATSSLSIRLG